MAKKVATKEEKERMNKISQMGCFCCGHQAEVHHIRKHTGMGLRPPHSDTIPLCSLHHRTGKDSIHLGKNLFIEKYGTEQLILQKINKQLEFMEDAYNLFNNGEN
tara:strand:+ start:344 stop:658 length:315 start_codon:yes stop_codon:yes gene_type:complete